MKSELACQTRKRNLESGPRVGALVIAVVAPCLSVGIAAACLCDNGPFPGACLNATPPQGPQCTPALQCGPVQIRDDACPSTVVCDVGLSSSTIVASLCQYRTYHCTEDEFGAHCEPDADLWTHSEWCRIASGSSCQSSGGGGGGVFEVPEPP